MKKTITIICILFLSALLLLGVFSDQINGYYQNRKLFNAIENNDLDAAKVAIKKGAWINTYKSPTWSIEAYVENNFTPLISACKQGNEEMIALLLENGADINKRDYFLDISPLHMVFNEHRESRFRLARYLIEQGADINAVRKGYYSPFQQALYISPNDSDQAKQESLTLLIYLLEHDADRTIYHQYNPLTYAARYNNLLAVEHLIVNGYYDVDCYDSAGNTALIIAVQDDDLDMVKLLLSLRADKSLQDSNGKTALDYANESSNVAIVSMLNGK